MSTDALPAIAVVPQRRAMDCGVAALSMLLATPYEDVYVATCAIDVTHARHGLNLRELQAIAKRLGTTLARRRRSTYDLDTDTGILHIRGNTKTFWGHYVVLFRGVVIDPDGGAVYEDLTDYLTARQARPCTLLVKD